MPRYLTTKQAAEEFGLSVKKFSEKIAPHLTPINLGARTRRYDIHEINQVADELLEKAKRCCTKEEITGGCALPSAESTFTAQHALEQARRIAAQKRSA